MFARLNELQLQKAISLSDLPLPGVCTKALTGNLRLVLSMQGLKVMTDGSSGRQKKARISFEQKEISPLQPDGKQSMHVQSYDSKPWPYADI